MTEVRQELQRLRPIEEELGVRKAEDRRLSEIVVNLRQDIVSVGKDLEERTTSIPYLAEQRTHDNKRIVQLQQENVELFKRVEEASSKVQLLELKQQKLESQTQVMPGVIENMKRSQEQFTESLKLADADRQRQMREWGATFVTQAALIEKHRQRLQDFVATFEETRSVLTTIDKFHERIQRDQAQVAELQRLAEERQKKEIANFVADNEKRWRKQILEWDYRWDQQAKHNVTVVDRFPPIEADLSLHRDLLNFFWRYVDAQGQSQLTAAQKWLDEVQKLVDQRDKILKTHEESRLDRG